MKANIVNIFEKDIIESVGKTFDQIIKDAVVDDLYDKYETLLKENNLTGKENKITVWKDQDSDLYIFQISFDDHPEDLYLQVAKDRMKH